MIYDTLQLWAERFRTGRAEHHQAAAKRHLHLRDAYRRTVDQPWSDLIPCWMPWSLSPVLWVCVALLTWWIFW